MALTIGELLLESGLKMVRQEAKIKKLKAKVALLEEIIRRQQLESPPSTNEPSV